jgi:heme/copper-type cytochrome/quinol oxidase subunit 2
VSVGLYATGAVAYGWWAATGAFAVSRELALGALALAEHPNDPVAIAFAEQTHVGALAMGLLLVLFALVTVPLSYFVVKTRQPAERKERT